MSLWKKRSYPNIQEEKSRASFLVQEPKEEEIRLRAPLTNMPVLFCTNEKGALSSLDLRHYLGNFLIDGRKIWWGKNLFLICTKSTIRLASPTESQIGENGETIKRMGESGVTVQMPRPHFWECSHICFDAQKLPCGWTERKTNEKAISLIL